ncbi:MAPEG family protein [Candidatus Berkiella aquae]|uniref:Inner membrane protein YecN n=1 Tax=Candidatus Berkiella aquae TaxID=295108 RepID=A0A0Q9YXN4_9GAMM|nr:MAPEG family protein [Candidatus Berkiella aquae]MCS5710559.1 MAPEG family protein [Candidatus Berkiella aquae]
MPTLYITGFYATLLAFFIMVLTVRVVHLRIKYRVGFLDGGHEELTKAIRVHGNAIETIPMVLILMACAEVAGISSLALHIAGIALVLARVHHATGLTRSLGRSKGRTYGTILTMLVIIGLGAFNLVVFTKSLFP